MLNAEKIITDGLYNNNTEFNRYGKLSKINGKTYEIPTIVIENEYGESDLIISFNEMIKVSFVRWNQDFDNSEKGANDALNTVINLLNNKACIIEYPGTVTINQYYETNVSSPTFYNSMVLKMEGFLTQNSDYMQGWTRCWDDTKSVGVGSPVMEKLMIEKLSNLYDTIENDTFHSDKHELFAGCGLIVTSDANYKSSEDAVFISPDALFVSQVVFVAWEICKPYYDDFRKDDFFCGIESILINGQRGGTSTNKL